MEFSQQGSAKRKTVSVVPRLSHPAGVKALSATGLFCLSAARDRALRVDLSGNANHEIRRRSRDRGARRQRRRRRRELSGARNSCPRGGPDGGDGGRGGSIYVVADRNINTLIDYRYARIHRAKNGENGPGRRLLRRGADDIVLRVPVGTVITDFETGELVADLAEHEAARAARARAARAASATSTSSRARTARRGSSRAASRASSRKLKLELKVLADVGCSACRTPASRLHPRGFGGTPKVADYPFTTLHPNLGVVRVGRARSFVIADIPGLIEGAAEGAGLGHQFLRHLAAHALLLHLVDMAPFDDGRRSGQGREGNRRRAQEIRRRRSTTSRAGWC